MKNIIKNSCTVVVFGFVLNFISNKLKSDYLITFIDQNLITLLIALLAINITTLSVIMSKLWEIADKHHINFSNTVKQMKLSILEQILFIGIAIVLQILKTSIYLKAHLSGIESISNVLLIAVFIYDILVLYDTSRSIFIILKSEKKQN
ncbi:MAG: hypothetical protein ACOCUT_00910 [bacterium]